MHQWNFMFDLEMQFTRNMVVHAKADDPMIPIQHDPAQKLAPGNAVLMPQVCSITMAHETGL